MGCGGDGERGALGTEVAQLMLFHLPDPIFSL